MTKIVTGAEISSAIRDCQPKRIAVAYLGVDWRDYIFHPDHLDSIVISPTLGSNPYAIDDLSKVLSWEKIFFLDELHAKFYLGADSAVVGSANLTSNGLSGEALIECCLTTTVAADLARLGVLFDELANKGSRQYPTISAKQERLAELKLLWNRAISQRIIKSPITTPRSVRDFQLSTNEELYVVWYTSIDCEYVDEVKKLDRYIADEIHFHPEDHPEDNRFVLTWRKAKNDTLDRRSKPRWMYIHQIFREGIEAEDYEYTTIAIQWKDCKVPPEPFEITEEVASRFEAVINSRKLNSYFVQDESHFRLNATHEGLPHLLAALQIKG